MYHKWRSYDIWFLKYKVWQTKNFVIFGNFLPFEPLTIQKIKISKLKKTPGDIIILNICTINDVWCMVPEIWSVTDKFFCLSGPFSALLSSYGSRKSKFWKIKKTPGDIIILHTCTLNDSHMMYGSWDMECNGQNFFVILGHFLPFYPRNNRKISKFWKIIKNIWRYYHFTQVYQRS